MPRHGMARPSIFSLKTGTYSPCIFIKKPYTFAYRVHRIQTLSIRNDVCSMPKGCFAPAPGNAKEGIREDIQRRLDRYAIIGGVALNLERSHDAAGAESGACWRSISFWGRRQWFWPRW